MRVAFRIVSLAALLIPASAQSDEAELKRISEMARICRAESVKFREAGGRPGAPGDPALKWSTQLWQYGQEHPGTPAGVQATTQALSWLRHADQDAEVIAKTGALPLDFPNWGSVIDGLRQSARKKDDYAPFLTMARRLLEHSKDNRLRAAVQVSLGRAYSDQGRRDQAIAAFQAAVAAAPGSPPADEADTLLYEMRNLQVGQTAPAFEAKTIDGKRISSDDFRGKVVLLNFWASW